MKREVEVQWNHMWEGDRFLRYQQGGAVMMLVVEREFPDIPTEVGSVGRVTTADGTEVVAKVALGDGGGRDWVSLGDNRTTIWRKAEDFREYTPLALHEPVSYGDIRDVFYNQGLTPRNDVVEAIKNLLGGES